jgi:hypothetical protein
MSMASAGGRTAAIHLPLGQLALLGVGTFCVMNPDKFLHALHKATASLLMLPSPDVDADATSRSSSAVGTQQQQQPIVIHQTIPAATTGASSGSSSSKTITTAIVQIAIGAGCCWGTYVLLVRMLPETMKGMLPVSATAFHRAVTSLGKAVIHLKETVQEQVMNLSKKQDDLSTQQEETHGEVLNVKDSVSNLKEDLMLIQESLNLCHSTLSESDRRTAYIAHGVQLLTRGVSTFLPEDDSLLAELVQFNTAGDEFFKNHPAKLLQLRQLLRNLQRKDQGQDNNRLQQAARQEAVLLTSDNDGEAAPENEVPSTPSSCGEVERSVVEVRALLTDIQQQYGRTVM